MSVAETYFEFLKQNQIPIEDGEAFFEAMLKYFEKKPRVQVDIFGKNCFIDGSPVDPINQIQCNVIRALLRAGYIGYTGKQLKKESGHSDAQKILYRLCDKRPEWANVIDLPKICANRYRLKD